MPGIGTVGLAAAAVVGSAATISSALDRNERQQAWVEDWSSKPIEEQVQWHRDGRPGEPQDWVTQSVIVGGVVLGAASVVGAGMNAMTMGPVLRTMGGVGLGLCIAGAAGLIADGTG